MPHLFYHSHVQSPAWKDTKELSSWGILVNANHAFPTRETADVRAVPCPPAIRAGFFCLYPHTHRFDDLQFHWESKPAVSEGPHPRCSLWMQSNVRPLFEFPGNSSPAVQVSSRGDAKRLRHRAGHEGLFLELSSKKPHLPMCSVKMEKGDFTPEVGGFWDFHFLTQHHMYRQARGG